MVAHEDAGACHLCGGFVVVDEDAGGCHLQCAIFLSPVMGGGCLKFLACGRVI